MADDSSRSFWGIAALAVLGVVAAVWWLRDPDPTSDTAAPATASPTDASAPAASASERPPPPPPGARAPSQSIAERGRLSVRLDDLREGDVFAIGLEMPDEPRGDGPRKVKVVDVAGRVFETTAGPIAGYGTGLRLEIDPVWLRPGQYMIQVETAERTHLALRRYVLDVE